MSDGPSILGFLCCMDWLSPLIALLRPNMAPLGVGSLYVELSELRRMLKGVGLEVHDFMYNHPSTSMINFNVRKDQEEKTRAFLIFNGMPPCPYKPEIDDKYYQSARAAEEGLIEVIFRWME